MLYSHNIILLVLFVIGNIPFQFIAQDTLFFENFENPTVEFTLNSADLNSSVTGDFNYWTVNNFFQGGSGSIICLGFPFNFTVPSTPSQPPGIEHAPMSNYMHIVSAAAANSGINCSSFIVADGFCILEENYFAKMSDDINTIGLTDIELSFWWMNASMSEIIGEVFYSIDAGNSWILVPGAGSLGGQSSWTQSTFSNGVFENQSTLRFGFRFINMTSFNALDPPLSIDDVVITATEECTDIFLVLETDLCEGDSIFAEGAYQTTGGTYTDVYDSQGGCDSTVVNMVSLFPIANYSVADGFFCEGDSILFHGMYITESSFFIEVLTYVNGCDSSVFEDNATFISLDTAVTLMGDTLSAPYNSSNYYQWIDCSTGAEIPGATDNVYVPTNSGSYAVVINSNFIVCSNTSGCIEVILTSISENPELTIDVFPNPIRSELNIQSSNRIKLYELFDSRGRIVKSDYLNRNSRSIPTHNVESGTYLISIEFENGYRYKELIVKY